MLDSKPGGNAPTWNVGPKATLETLYAALCRSLRLGFAAYWGEKAQMGLPIYPWLASMSSVDLEVGAVVDDARSQVSRLHAVLLPRLARF